MPLPVPITSTSKCSITRSLDKIVNGAKPNKLFNLIIVFFEADVSGQRQIFGR